MVSVRTDLVLEAQQAFHAENPKTATFLQGVRAKEETIFDCRVNFVEVLDDEGAKALSKPIGNYATLELDGSFLWDDEEIDSVSRAIGELLLRLLPKDGTILVCGLGNRRITADSVGPVTLESVMVTRHLIARDPEHFGGMRPVSAIAPGVLGTTGVESAELIKGLCDIVSPAAVIAVDALCARSATRLGRSIQITDAGISPGSGVGNARNALNSAELGIPVIALGLPTVVDLSDTDKSPLIVTPKDVDTLVSTAARSLGRGINYALHRGISSADMDSFLA